MEKHKKIITFNKNQWYILNKMMEKRGLQDDFSFFINLLLVEEWKRQGGSFPIKKTREMVEQEIIKKLKKHVDYKKWQEESRLLIKNK